MGKAHVAHFVVTGEFITQQARSFWSEEDEPERAINLLKNLHGITDAQIMDILEGRSKLTGDSDGKGVQLVPDKAKQPTLKQVLGKLKRERDEAREDVADAVQLLNGDTEFVGSPTGRRAVPSRRTKRNNRGQMVLAKGYSFPDAKGKQTDKDLRFFRESPSLLSSHTEHHLEDPEEPEPPPPPPPKPDNKITSDTGWISPDGKFYACKYAQHDETARRIGGTAHGMYLAGWMRCQTLDQLGKPEWTVFHTDYQTVTPEQRKVVQEYCEKNKHELPFWFDRDDK